MRHEEIFCDCLTGTLDIQKQADRVAVHERMIAMHRKHSRSGRIRYLGNWNRRYFDSWKISMRGHENSDAYVTVSYNPINERQRFLWIKVNPRSLGPEGMRRARAFLKKLLGTKHVRRLYSGMVVTRVDVTLDIAVKKFTYMPFLKNSALSLVYSADPISYSAGGWAKRLAIYDKGVQSGTAPPGQIIRVEFNIKGRRSAINNLVDAIDNPFRDLVLYKRRWMVDPFFDGAFVEEARVRGLNAALGALGHDPARRRFKRRLDKYYRVNVLNAEALWAGWGNAVAVFDVWRNERYPLRHTVA